MGERFNHIGQLFVFNVETIRNYENKLKQLFEEYAKIFNWGFYQFKLMSVNDDTTYGFITFADNSVHLDVIRRLDLHSFGNSHIRIRVNGFTNDRINISSNINYERQKRGITIFNQYFGENITSTIPSCVLDQASSEDSMTGPFSDVSDWDADKPTKSMKVKRAVSSLL